MSNTVYLTASTNAIDAFLYRKSDGIEAKISRGGIDRRNVVVIGDGDNDLDMFVIPQVFSRGCPRNALDSVKEVVRQLGGHVSQYPVMDGFFDIVADVKMHAQQQGYNSRDLVVFTDRDGVLTAKRNYSEGDRFADFIKGSGIDQPRTYILTGSSVAQNKDSGFMAAYGLTPENLRDNYFIQQDPYLIGCENGTLWINVLDDNDVRSVVDKLHPDTLRKLMQDFKEEVLDKLQKQVLPVMDLTFIEKYGSRRNPRGVYCSPKQSMVTLNIPHAIRGTDQEKEYVSRVLDVMQEVAKQVGLQVDLLASTVKQYS
ncbi:HAD hydrolase family protein [Candidatus Woesearchaeota archaeon]|nr:HAD hydrolase family protein [Candidatus Woesearchaeota archaeon]